VPFCTTALAKLALSLPSEYLVADDGTAKAVLRQAVREIVPGAVLSREKVGFAVPERIWLGSLRPWMLGCLEATSPSDAPFLRWRALPEATMSRLGGRDHVASVPWRLLNVSRWVSVFSVDARN
jgi:asparagine synthase (glutamine-hydrolysing)